MDRNRFKCRYCGETRLKKTQGGGYACAYCGRQPETMMASSMVMNESYGRAGTYRGRTFVAERAGANKKEELITDLEHHLEENWLSYLQYFQRVLKANITSLQQKLNLDPKVIAITKKIWEVYLQKWVESKKRIVSFFSVPRKGLYRSEDPTFPKRKYDTAFDQIEEMSDFQDEDDGEDRYMNNEPEVSKFNFDFIFSQLSEGVNTNFQATQEKELDAKLKKVQKEIKQTRREYYSARFWIKPKENLKARKRRRKSTIDNLDGIPEHIIEEENASKKTKRLPKKLFADSSIDFLQNIHHRYLKVSKITLNQIVEDYNQVLNYEQGDKKEKLRSLKRRSSYLKIEHLQNALNERNIDTEILKPCHNRQAFQKMAKELIFIHDYFCFVVYKHTELEPVTLHDILHHLNKTTPFEEPEAKDDKQETITNLAKDFISKHLAQDQELSKPEEEPKKGPKLFPLEFNLIPLICFVALRVAYYPVFPKDMYEWIRCEIMPFFTVPEDCSTDGLKDYLIKPTNIPSPAWIRTSFKSFVRIYEIEIPQNVLFTKNIIERTFLDCGLPRKLEETCFRLYTLITLIRKDHQVKSIDEDLTIVAVVLATLKLFYGFDDNFYGIFLNLVKANEISKATKDDKIRISLFNLINIYEKLGETDHVMKKMSEIPKFDSLINEWQNKISKGEFNVYFKYEEEKNQQIPWDYKDLRYLNKTNVLEYLDNVKEKFFPKDNEEQNEFRKLQEEFKELYFDEVQTTNYEQDDYLNPKIMTNATLFDHQAAKKAKISTFFSQELEFVSTHQDLVNRKKSFEEEEEQVAMPLPCDNYFIYKKFQSIPNNKIKNEFLFLLNLFSAYLLEPLEDIRNALKFIDKHLIELCSLVDN